MRVVVLNEWDASKDEEKYRKGLEISRKWIEYWIKLSKEKSITPVYDKIFTDNTGHISNWTEYESMADFQKIWDDETYQGYWAQFSRYADNCRIRVMRPVSIGVDV
jgi:hypothetical protein